MPNLELLQEKISDSGMTMVAIAQKSGISRETLYNKLKGQGEFKASEIIGLTKALRLSTEDRDAIFFDSWRELNSLKDNVLFETAQAEEGA